MSLKDSSTLGEGQHTELQSRFRELSFYPAGICRTKPRATACCHYFTAREVESQLTKSVKDREGI